MAETMNSPIQEVKKPAGVGAAPAPTIRLKPVIRKPGTGLGAATDGVKPPIVKPLGPQPTVTKLATSEPAAAPASPLDQLKGMTQKLKGITQEIPSQAILRQTGIIAGQNLTEAQKTASKSSTMRISLSDAIGVAPVTESNAPMKTIRIKRPVDLPTSKSTVAPAPEAAAPEAPAAAEKAPTMTQRKTLKIARPGLKRGPSLSVHKSGTAVPKPAAAPNAEAEVADIPDIPDMPANAPAFQPAQADGPADPPKGVSILGIIVQIAACGVMGFLAWMLYTDTTLLFAF